MKTFILHYHYHCMFSAKKKPLTAVTIDADSCRSKWSISRLPNVFSLISHKMRNSIVLWKVMSNHCVGSLMRNTGEASFLCGLSLTLKSLDWGQQSSMNKNHQFEQRRWSGNCWKQIAFVHLPAHITTCGKAAEYRQSHVRAHVQNANPAAQTENCFVFLPQTFNTTAP